MGRLEIKIGPGLAFGLCSLGAFGDFLGLDSLTGFSVFSDFLAFGSVLMLCTLSLCIFKARFVPTNLQILQEKECLKKKMKMN